MKGKVWLVGAGPGDPGLLTKKAYEVLKSAEVVVYDSLVSDAILALMPQDAKKIDAGKRAGNHTLRQEETNQILLEEALKGNRVVRLKGGDPFLFGRGGEELELLVENGVEYEIIPGITSAISVPAYNGIPVTHRDYTSSLHIITGHKKQGEEYDIDFDALVRTKGTLVFLMGVSALPDIMSCLMAAGMDADMPAAILQQGTTARQKKIVATVATLEQKVKELGIDPPGIIVVGKVCALADEFAWWEKLPLFGYKVLLTRPKELISQMAVSLRELGAEVVELPSIETKAIEPNETLSNAFLRLNQYGWVVFTSPSGVRIFFEQMKKHRVDLRALANAKFAALGEGTKKELEAHGFFADVMPNTYYGKQLGEAVAAVAKPGERILIPRASIGNQEIIEALKDFDVDDIATYDTLPISQEIISIEKQIEEKKLHLAVFTSSSGVNAFTKAYPSVDFSKLQAACIGEKTAEAAKKAGMQVRIAQKPTMDSLLELVISLRNEILA